MIYKHLDGLHVSDLNAVVIAAAHLSQADRFERSLDIQWPDMESVIEQQSRQGLGLRDLTNSANAMLAAAKHFGIAIGIDLTACTKRDGKRAAPGIKRAMIPLEMTSVMIKKQYKLAPSSPFNQLLVDTFPELQKMGHLSSAAMRKACYQLPYRIFVPGALVVDENFHEQWKQHHKLTPVQLLSGLRTYRNTT